MNITVAIVISFFIPLVYLYALRKLDLFGTGKFHYNLATILWGIIAYTLAASINSTLLNAKLITYSQLLRLVAPIIEEILKSGILLYLVRRKDFNYVVDGAIYGSGTGIGFAVAENYEYIIRNPEEAVIVALARVLSTNLIHAATSGLIGCALAVGRIERRSPKTVLLAGGLTLAMVIHVGFNIIVDGGVSLGTAFILGIVSVLFIVAIIQQGLKIQQAWIGEMLGTNDRVTYSEAIAAQRLQSLDDVLSPVTRHFGTDKASKARSLVSMQAEIGIKRKILETMQDEKKCQELEAEIQRITADMNNLRKGIGPYCMLFIRILYLENEDQVWKLINERVAVTGTNQAGGGLWSRLDDRLKASKNRKNGQ
jgi:RsiW-degrading membrane proteinase PrsW (M82 family)